MAERRNRTRGGRPRATWPLTCCLFCCLALLAACGTGQRGYNAGPYNIAPLPEVEGYLSSVPAGHTRYSNESLAHVFVQLTHFFETGKRSPGLFRFEGPITVGIVGNGAAQYRPFLQQVTDQISREAGLDIRVADEPVNILIRMIPGRLFRALAPNQCILIKGQPTWATFFLNPKKYVLPSEDSPLAMTREGVLIPDNIEPYKVRQCILEELVQTLGTSNDLFGLGASMFNDDQGHYWPTKLDYLMLKVLYDPEMQTSREVSETHLRARRILARLNPEGETAPELPPMRLKDFKEWREKLLKLRRDSHKLQAKTRVQAAKDLANDARRRAEGSAYECLGKTAVAYAMQDNDMEAAREAFNQAIATCGQAHGDDDIRIATLRLARAFVDYEYDRFEIALETALDIWPVLIAHGQDDKVAAAAILQTAAAAKLDDPEWKDIYLPRAVTWSAYAVGEDNRLTRTLRR